MPLFKLIPSGLILLLIFSCSNQKPEIKEVSDYCEIIESKLWSFSRLSKYEKDKFKELQEKRLSKYIDLFMEAGELNNIDWELIAAVAFQESQWNPKARSATEVKGMMMLTLPTAKSLGVNNRLNAKQSIMGGGKHLANLSNQVEYGTSSGDRIAFVLATYNLGFSNIKNIIDSTGLNRSEVRWLDLEEKLLNDVDNNALPGNSKDYSRGQQTVDFVERVRDYYYLLLSGNCDQELIN